MRKVLVATPCYDGKVDVWYANSLINMVMLGIEKNILFRPVYMSYDALVQRARNDLLAIAVENEFDDILWIDADMEWDPQKAIQILELKQDVIGLPVIKKTLESEIYNIKGKPEDLFIKNGDGLIRVESIGTGFLKMSKTAFTYLWESSPEYVHNGKSVRWVFDVKLVDGDIMSEDVHVATKLKEGGFDIWVDPSSTCNHIGNMKYYGNFEDFLKRLQKFLEDEKDFIDRQND